MPAPAADAGVEEVGMSLGYQVGAEVEAACKKCGEDRMHVIASLKSDGNIHKVTCRTCEGTHLFRRPASTAKKRTAVPRRKKGAVTVTDAEAAKGKSYSLDGDFHVGDIINHKKFGAGRVLELRSGGKMEVGFEDGPKTLVRKGWR
jgi:hypothetical protein